MSTIKALVPFQFETFGQAGHHHAGGHPSRSGTGPAEAAPRRQSAFITQLLVDGDADLRKRLGRRDVAGQREAAYGGALAGRPSRQPNALPLLEDSV